jgi:cell wall-associated NlpC family hydrolase
MRSTKPQRPRRLPLIVLSTISVILLVGVGRAMGITPTLSVAQHRPDLGIVTQPTPGPDTATESAAPVAPLGQLRAADVLLTAKAPIPAATVADIRRIPGVSATEPFRYGTVNLAGNPVPAYGVDPSTFRNWAVRLTAASDAFWQSLAAGEASASFQTAKDLNLPLGAHLPIGAGTSEPMRLGSFATVGLPDAEAVLSDQRAAEIGLPPASGLLVSAPGVDLRQLTGALSAASGSGVAVRPLRELPPIPTPPPAPAAIPAPAGTAATTPETTSGGSAGTSSAPAASSGSVAAVVAAAKSKIGAPYAYGASGPDSFDCSGFTSWVYRQVGISLPRTAQEQWLAGPHVSYADARPGDILAWAGDPSAPGYVTHVAIYLGNGQMISAQHTGTTVAITPVYTSGLLGAVRVLP